MGTVLSAPAAFLTMDPDGNLLANTTAITGRSGKAATEPVHICGSHVTTTGGFAVMPGVNWSAPSTAFIGFGRIQWRRQRGDAPQRIDGVRLHGPMGVCAIVRRFLLTALFLLGVVSALAGNSPTITGVTLTSGYFSGNPTSGTPISPIVVVTTGSFTGTLALGGPDAAKFSISGLTLNSAATLTPGIDYALTITPTQAGWVNSGVPASVHVYGGVTYFMSPGGNDSNNGTSSGTPWKTTAHNIHCDDKIMAAAGSYPPQSFGYTTWGTVSCPANDNVAWVKCATAFACDVNGEFFGKGAVAIDMDYWGVQGFTATDSSGTDGACFQATPRTQFHTINHIVFANDVANTCPLVGFGTSDFNGALGPAAVDYVMYVGDLAWNAAISSSFCGSAIGTASPAMADNAPGPHMLWTLNIATNTIDGNNCANGGASGGSTDGQGFMIDRPDVFHYTAIIVAENNLAVANGAPGFHQFVNGTGGMPQNVIVRNNTFFGNLQDPNFCPFTDGEVQFNNGGVVTVTNNIMVATLSTKCGGGTVGIYAQSTESVQPATILDKNWLWNTALSTNISVNWNSGYSCLSGAGVPNPGRNSNGHVYCSGNTVADPVMAGPTTTTGQWFCSGFSDTQACAAPMIARFTPTASGSSTFGFTAPTSVDQYNSTPFFRNVMHALPPALNPHGF
jgi:hypothetical protein